MVEPVHDVGELRRRVDSSLERVVGRGSAVALVNFPNHGNPGDPALWLGTRASLARLGCRVVYSCGWAGFSREALDAALPDGPVLINGGGNLGDLYAGQQALRERLLTELRGRRIVQLPQSIHFRQRVNLERMQRLVAQHGDVVLMVREERSQAFAHDHFDAPVHLSPDHAFGLGPWPRSGPAQHPVVWLVRRPGDPEHVDHGPPPEDLGAHVVEWLHGVQEDERSWDRRGRAMLAVDRRLTARAAVSPSWARYAWRPVAATYAPLARRWVQRGVDVLGAGEVVVTDKLHGHVLCLLTGTPHVVLDNSYGKVRATWDTWTRGMPGAVWADDADQAAAAARRLLGTRE